MGAERGAIFLPGREKTSGGNENCLHILLGQFCRCVINFIVMMLSYKGQN